MTRRLVVALLATVLVAVSCGGDDGGDTGSTNDGSSTAGTEIRIEFEDGEYVGELERIDVPIGDVVTVVAVGDRDEQVHVHGYDLYIEPDGDDTLTFDALIPGRFEIELEQSGRLLLEITVS